MNTLSKFLAVSMLCATGAAHAADIVTKQSMMACLAASHDKYTLYQTCIGQFTDACAADYDAYTEALRDISVGPPTRNCIERESIWWGEIFKQYSQALTQATQQRTSDARVQKALVATLSDMDKRALRECGYVTTRWGYRQGDLVQIQGLDDQFQCISDINAENAITVYLWSRGTDQ
ncbi:MAG: hypothetical protein DI582_10615 [Azospirillum brasilense]|nr:MAG: hypothetical protein DI582_10615 [Azospirillum brasilense]